jgi:hypothetical protein
MFCRNRQKIQQFQWQGQQGSNPRPTVLETVALPAELYPYASDGLRQVTGEVKGFCNAGRGCQTCGKRQFC